MKASELDNYQQVATELQKIANQLSQDMEALLNLKPSDMRDRPGYWLAQVIQITNNYAITELSRVDNLSIQPMLQSALEDSNTTDDTKIVVRRKQIKTVEG